MRERELFLAACEIDDVENRFEYLQEACGDDSVLRKRVEDLLAIDREERNLFNQSPLEAAASHLAATAEECEGTILGRYKLLEKIGEGGFALVYMAEQTEPVRRQVAVKVIKAGMDTKQVIARFEAERQALGLMDHPNIAKVYDGGTTPNGRPYFVMELVRGSRITEFCDAQRLTTAERMGVFLQVCRAVQHAHQKGIIHRDLKPSNILVAIHDDAPAPKVIDFGIAKAIEQPLTDRTLFTRFHQFIGTPAYMSPEQATLGGSDIDTRTDVYSLGAVLYELLTGVAPIDARQLEKVAFDEVSRIIREDQPTLPSARISTLGVRQQSVAANRGIDPQGLQRFVRGDLDWIIMKALEKDRSRRYDTVSALAADVQHFLADEPVLACPPSPWYRFRKLVRRNRGPVLAALLVLVALLAGIIGTSWQWRRAEANLNEANKAGERLQDQLWQSLFQQARAQIYSGQPGQRHKALEAVREAARIRRSPELRDLAIAALARTDIRLGKQWARTPAGTDFLVFDADLEWHAWADVNGTVSVRRVADDQVLVSLYDPAYMGALLRFSADQKYLAVAYGFSPQRYLDVWDLERSDKLVLKQPVYANGFDFTPDSRQVAVAQGDGAIGLFDLGTSALLRPLGKGPVPNDLVISPDGTRLAVSQAFGPQVQVRDLATGDVQVTVAHPEIEAYDLAWHSHDPNLLATASLGIYLWDLRFPEKPIATLPGQAGPTTNIAFSHDGGILASKGWVDTSVRLWDAWTGRQLVQIPGTSAHGDIPLQFSRDDRLLAFYSNGTHIGLWELEVAREFRSLGSHASRGQGNYPSLDISSDGRLLVASSRYGSSNGIRLWDLDTGKELAFLPVGPTFAVRFHPGGGALFSSHSELGVCVWPLRGGRERLHVGPPRRLGPARTAAQLSVSADGRRLAVVYEDCGMVFELAEPAPFPVVGLSTGILSTELLSFLMNRDEPGVSFVQGHVNQVAFSPDAHWLATAMSGGAGVMVFDVKTRKHVKTLPALLYSGAEFSPDPDGKWLVTSAADEYCIYETGTWERRHVLPRTAGGDSPGPVAFTPDGKVLAVVLNGVTVELRDPATARVLATLEPPEPDRNLPSVLRFSPDGSQLAVCTTELRMLYVWDLRLLGQRLAELGQDWELPDFSAAPASGVRKPLKVEVNLGDFAAQEHRQNSRDHLRARDWQSAFDEASKAIELSEDDAEAWRLRALARMALKEYELAVADFRQALKLGLQDALALNNIAWELVVTPDAPPNLVGYSVDWAKAAVDLQPTQAFYWNTLGVAHYRAGDFKAAIKALETAEELKPDTAFAFNAFFLAMAHWQLDAKDLARQWFDRAIDWMEKRPAELQNSPVWQEELRGFRSEAESLMGIETK